MARKIWSLSNINRKESADIMRLLNIRDFEFRNIIGVTGLELGAFATYFDFDDMSFLLVKPTNDKLIFGTTLSAAVRLFEIDLETGFVKLVKEDLGVKLAAGFSLDESQTKLCVTCLRISDNVSIIRKYNLSDYSYDSDIIRPDSSYSYFTTNGAFWWSADNTYHYLRKHELTNIDNVLDIFQFPSDLHSVYSITFDAITGYFWLKGINSLSIPKTYVWNSATNAIVFEFEHGVLGETGRVYYARHQWALDLWSKTGPELANITLLGDVFGSAVNVRYSLRDYDGARFNMIAHEFSIDNGITWKPATAGLGGDGEVNLLASWEGIPYIWVWNSLADIGNQNISNVKIKFKFEIA